MATVQGDGRCPPSVAGIRGWSLPTPASLYAFASKLVYLRVCENAHDLPLLRQGLEGRRSRSAIRRAAHFWTALLIAECSVKRNPGKPGFAVGWLLRLSKEPARHKSRQKNCIIQLYLQFNVK